LRRRLRARPRDVRAGRHHGRARVREGMCLGIRSSWLSRRMRECGEERWRDLRVRLLLVSVGLHPTAERPVVRECRCAGVQRRLCGIESDVHGAPRRPLRLRRRPPVS
jgi:hypothetical protein